MNERLLKAKEEGRLAKLEFTNSLNMPITISVNRTSTKLVTNHKLKGFELHFITRRSTLNPGELGKIHVITEAPITEYEPSAYFCLSVGESVTSNIWWGIPLNGEGSDPDFHEWLKKKKRESKS